MRTICKRRNKEEERKKRQNERKDLTLTGLLMEGLMVSPIRLHGIIASEACHDCSECTRLRGEGAAAFADYTARKDELTMTRKRAKSFAAKRRAFEQAKGRLRECHKRESNHRAQAHSGHDS
jgi:hypothetical protein